MSRSAVFDALSEDSTLNGLGITEDTIFPNWSLDQSPSRIDPFVIIRWGAKEVKFGTHGPRSFDIWVHNPIESGNDFGIVDEILNRCIEVLLATEHREGQDGLRVTTIRFTGSGSDFKDPGFNTITRNASFQLIGDSIAG